MDLRRLREQVEVANAWRKRCGDRPLERQQARPVIRDAVFTLCCSAHMCTYVYCVRRLQ
jgi:hypothetical protein